MSELKFSTPVAVLIAGIVVAAAIFYQPTPANGRYVITRLGDSGDYVRVDTVRGSATACNFPDGEPACRVLFNSEGDFAPYIESEQLIEAAVESLRREQQNKVR